MNWNATATEINNRLSRVDRGFIYTFGNVAAISIIALAVTTLYFYIRKFHDQKYIRDEGASLPSPSTSPTTNSGRTAKQRQWWPLMHHSHVMLILYTLTVLLVINSFMYVESNMKMRSQKECGAMIIAGSFFFGMVVHMIILLDQMFYTHTVLSLARMRESQLRVRSIAQSGPRGATVGNLPDITVTDDDFLPTSRFCLRRRIALVACFIFTAVMIVVFTMPMCHVPKTRDIVGETVYYCSIGSNGRLARIAFSFIVLFTMISLHVKTGDIHRYFSMHYAKRYRFLSRARVVYPCLFIVIDFLSLVVDALAHDDHGETPGMAVILVAFLSIYCVLEYFFIAFIGAFNLRDYRGWCMFMPVNAMLVDVGRATPLADIRLARDQQSSPFHTLETDPADESSDVDSQAGEKALPAPPPPLTAQENTLIDTSA